MIQKDMTFADEKGLTPEDIDRIIELAWEDRTPFEAIKVQFDVDEKIVIKIMRNSLKPKSFRRWRTRVNQGVSHKHLMKQPQEMKRFKSAQQRQITRNKISKQK
jgi:uncharacterized protein (TIGR03643 family)